MHNNLQEKQLLLNEGVIVSDLLLHFALLICVCVLGMLSKNKKPIMSNVLRFLNLNIYYESAIYCCKRPNGNLYTRKKF